jgi:hypothetical protein
LLIFTHYSTLQDSRAKNQPSFRVIAGAFMPRDTDYV